MMLRQLLPRLGRWGVPVSIATSLVALGYLAIAMRAVYERGFVGTLARALVTLVLVAALPGAWLWSTTTLAERLA